MAEAADLQSAQEYYDFLVTSGQLKPDVFEEHRQLQERFGSAPAAAASMAYTSAESTPELDEWTRLFTEPTLTDEQLKDAPRIGTDYPDTDDDFLETSDSLADRLGRPTRVEKGIMSETGRSRDFPTPSEMQKLAGPINPNDRRSGFRKWVDNLSMPDREEKTDKFEEAESAKAAVLQKGEKAAVTEGTTGTEETPTKTETVSDPDAHQISLWQDDVAGTITNPVKKSVFDQGIEFINQMKVPEIGTEGGFHFFGDNKQDYLMLRDKIDTDIDKYETSIQAVAAEQQKPPLEGANKWIAILGVALGAAGSALTGTPNEAMQMLEGFMDREQQKFLKSKEMKMKSADQQRLDLIRRRGELIQQFQNETNRVLQISQFQLTKTTALANIKKIQEDLQQKLDQNSMENQIAVAKILKDVIVAQSTVRAKMTAEERKGIAPNMGTNPGEIGVSMLVGAARDKVMKEVVDFNRVYWGVSRAYDSVKDIIQKDKGGALSPEALSAARSDLVQRVTEIKLYAAKKLFQFGAALTKNEEALLDQIIGDADRMNVALGITETRMKNFMGIMEDKRLALRDAGGFSTLGGTTGVENQKAAPGGVIKARGTIRNK